jgi:hypothetical protein
VSRPSQSQTILDGDLNSLDAESDDDSFRTPLNLAGVYGLFLLNEITGAFSDPLKEWAISWVSSDVQQHDHASTDLRADLPGIANLILNQIQPQHDQQAFGLTENPGYRHIQESVDLPEVAANRLEELFNEELGGNIAFDWAGINPYAIENTPDASARISNASSVELQFNDASSEDGDQLLPAGSEKTVGTDNFSADSVSTLDGTAGENTFVSSDSELSESDPISLGASDQTPIPGAYDNETLFAEGDDTFLFALGDVADATVVFGTIDMNQDLLEVSTYSAGYSETLDAVAVISDAEGIETATDVAADDSVTLQDAQVAALTVPNFITASDFIV